MTADHPDVIRADVLRSLGADRETVEELSTYCDNPFPVDALPQPPALPLPEEAHTTDWRDYLDEQGDDPFGFLQSRLVQLNIPIQEGVSKTAKRVFRRPLRMLTSFAAANRLTKVPLAAG
jgi:hypothetical protein